MDKQQNYHSSNFEDLQEDLSPEALRENLRASSGGREIQTKRQITTPEVESQSLIRKLLLNFFRKLEDFTAFITYFNHVYLCCPDGQFAPCRLKGKLHESSADSPSPSCSHWEESSAVSPNMHQERSNSRDVCRTKYSTVIGETLFKLINALTNFQTKCLPVTEHMDKEPCNSVFILYLIEVSHILMEFVRDMLYRFSNLLKLGFSSAGSSTKTESDSLNMQPKKTPKDDITYVKEEMLKWRHHLAGKDILKDSAEPLDSGWMKTWFKTCDANQRSSKSAEKKRFDETNGGPNGENDSTASVPSMKPAKGKFECSTSEPLWNLDKSSSNSKTVEKKSSDVSNETKVPNFHNTFQQTKIPQNMKSHMRSSCEDSLLRCFICGKNDPSKMGHLEASTKNEYQMNDTAKCTSFSPKVFCKLCTIDDDKSDKTDYSEMNEDFPHIQRIRVLSLSDCGYSEHLNEGQDQSNPTDSSMYDESIPPNPQNLSSYKQHNETKLEHCVEGYLNKATENSNYQGKNISCKSLPRNIFQNSPQTMRNQPETWSYQEEKQCPLFEPGPRGYVLIKSPDLKKPHTKEENSNVDSADYGKRNIETPIVETGEECHHIVSLDITQFTNAIRKKMFDMYQEEQKSGVSMSDIENEFTVCSLINDCISQSFIKNSVLQDSKDSQTDRRKPPKPNKVQFQTPCANIEKGDESKEKNKPTYSDMDDYKYLENLLKSQIEIKEISDRNLQPKALDKFEILSNEWKKRAEVIKNSRVNKSHATQDMENMKQTQITHDIGKINENQVTQDIENMRQKQENRKEGEKVNADKKDGTCATCFKGTEDFLVRITTLSENVDYNTEESHSPRANWDGTEHETIAPDLIEIREIVNDDIRVYTVENPDPFQSMHAQTLERPAEFMFPKQQQQPLNNAEKAGLNENEELSAIQNPPSSKIASFREEIIKQGYIQGPTLLLKLHHENFVSEAFILLLCVNQLPMGRYKDIQVVFKDNKGEEKRSHKLEQNSFFHLLATHLFSIHDKKLFEPTYPGSRILCLNPSCKMEHTWFLFTGLVLAFSLLHQKPLGIHLPKAFFKCLLSRPFVIDDLREIDYNLYYKVMWISKTRLRESPVQLNFTIQEHGDHGYFDLELLPNGKDIIITDSNKATYIEKVIRWKLIGRSYVEMIALKKGLAMVINPDLLSMFTDEELQKLVLVGHLHY